MSSFQEKWKDLNVTRDEVKNIAEALKDEEFRKLLINYVEETQNPESIKKYQEDIVQLEAERGVDCKFINPEPGFVVKTSVNGVKKAFINVCSNSLIGKPVSKAMTLANNKGLSWSIPYSQAPGRDDVDLKRNNCIVYDVIFHPDTIYLAQNNNQFKKLVIDTALNGIEQANKVQLDKSNIKLPKLKYKGFPNPTVIRQKSKNPIILSDEDKEFHKQFKFPTAAPETNKKPTVITFTESEKAEKYNTPYYVIKHRNDIDMQEFTFDKHSKMNAAIPKELVVEINLPLLNSSAGIDLDILEKGLELICEKPVKYKLSLQLPYAVSQDGSAKFDTDKRILIVTLPVIRRFEKPNDYIREDSGVESDVGDVSLLEAMPQPNNLEEKVFEPEPFLENDKHYNLPSFDINRENNNLICFILNVKNVDPASISSRILQGKGFQVKFTSLGTGYFPIYYAYCARFNTEMSEDITIEAWDNNVTVQVQICDINAGDFVLVGLNEDELRKKWLDDVLVVTNGLKELDVQDDEEKENPIQVVSVHEDEVVFEVDMSRGISPEAGSDESSHGIPEPMPKFRTYSEGSGDEMGGNLRRSILKNRMSRSLSESCADDAGNGFAAGVLYTWSDSCISERQEDETKEVKKTVRFSQHIQRQTFRANSSILGQRRKNQKRSRNKKKSLERRVSESENSDGDDREKWTKTAKPKTSKTETAIYSVITKEDGVCKGARKPENKKCRKPKQIEFKSQLVHELDN